MDILYLLIPLSLMLIAAITWAFMWAIQSGQFDDLEGPAHEILLDDDSPKADVSATTEEATDTQSQARHRTEE